MIQNAHDYGVCCGYVDSCSCWINLWSSFALSLPTMTINIEKELFNNSCLSVSSVWCVQGLVVACHLPRWSTAAGVSKDLAHCFAVHSYLVVLRRHQHQVCIVVDSSSAEPRLTATSDSCKPVQSIAPGIARPSSTLSFGRHPQTLAPTAHAFVLIDLKEILDTVFVNR